MAPHHEDHTATADQQKLKDKTVATTGPLAGNRSAVQGSPETSLLESIMAVTNPGNRGPSKGQEIKGGSTAGDKC